MAMIGKDNAWTTHLEAKKVHIEELAFQAMREVCLQSISGTEVDGPPRKRVGGSPEEFEAFFEQGHP